MSHQSVALFVICLVGGANSAKTDLKKLAGTWEMVSGENDGEKLSDDEVKSASMVIEGDQYTVKFAENIIKGTIKLDPKKKPKAIDSTDGDGVARLGIYELKGDEFKTSTAAPGKDRPKDFLSGDSITTWKRAKK